MARNTNTAAAVVESTNVVAFKPTIQQIAAMSKSEREAYIASKTGKAQEPSLDLAGMAKHYANSAITGIGRATGVVVEVASGAKSAFTAGYLSALDDE